MYAYLTINKIWWRWGESNSWPPACKADALPTELHPHTQTECALSTLKTKQWDKLESLLLNKINFSSLERRWSSRTFRYGYLVTTSPQSPDLPSTAASYWLAHRLRVFPTLMAWRAVCTRPENVFTAVCWPAITSNSIFIQSNFRLQSELRQLLGFCSISLLRFPL